MVTPVGADHPRVGDVDDRRHGSTGLHPWEASAVEDVEVRVEITGTGQSTRSAVPVVRVHTPVGDTVVPWHGAPDAPPGRYDVEWTVDAPLTWGTDVRPEPVPEPGILTDGERVVLRGRLLVAADGTCALDVDGCVILLDLTAPPPADVDGTWVRLRVARDDVGSYPYEI